MGVARLAAAPVAGVLFSVVLFARTRGLDEIAQPGQLGPGFWPRLVLLGLGVACLAKLVTDVRAARRTGGAPAGDDRPERDGQPRISRSTLAAAVGLILLYVLLTPALGFPLASILFIAGFMWLAGARSVPGIAANAALGTVALLYLFVRFVYLPLPKGDGPFEALTLTLYRALRLF